MIMKQHAKLTHTLCIKSSREHAISKHMFHELKKAAISSSNTACTRAKV